jgi:hypothetical protein
MSARRVLSRWRHRVNRLRDEWSLQRDTWRVEREIERAVGGSSRIIVGPWLSEVGHEVLYWVPFVRWVQAAYRIPPDRLIVVSRGGVASWYSDITSRYVEVFDVVEPTDYASALAARVATTGTGKQVTSEALDQQVLDVVRRDRAAAGARVLHPSVMYRLFSQFWSGRQSLGFVERQTRYQRLDAPGVDLTSLDLPDRYIAVKCHAARSLPSTTENRRLVNDFITAVAAQTSVVLLETGLTLDEHDDFSLEGIAGVVSLRGRLDPRTNLAVQTEVIARAQAYVGTCGGLAWAAPMLGVETTAMVGDPRLLHAHLSVARRVYHRLGEGRFSTVDVGGLQRLGVSLAPAGPAEEPTS